MTESGMSANQEVFKIVPPPNLSLLKTRKRVGNDAGSGIRYK